MAYIPTVWKDRKVQSPSKFKITTNSDGTIELASVPGVITEEGTPISADTFNNMENGIKNNDTHIGDMAQITEGDLVNAIKNNRSQLAEKAYKAFISIDEYGAKGNANYYNPSDGKYYIDAGFTILADDDTQAFINALNDVQSKGLGLKLSKKSFLITNPLPFFDGLIMEGCSFSTRICYIGINYLFEVVSATDIGNVKFANFNFLSSIGAGGFIGFHKTESFTTPGSLSSIMKMQMDRVQFYKQVASSGAMEGLNISTINAKGLMNCTFNECYFLNWDLVLNMQQCDINKFNHCLFRGNVQIAYFKYLNTYGSQNEFHQCDFEVRRNYTENYYQFDDEARYTTYDDCYFEVGKCNFTPTSPTVRSAETNKIKGWLLSDAGEKNLIACRFDYNDDMASEALFNVKSLGSMNCIGCNSNGYPYSNYSQKVIIQPSDGSYGLDANQTNFYSIVNLIGCNQNFMSHFDKEQRQITIVGRQYIDTINEGRLLTSNLFYDRNTAFNGLEKVSLISGDAYATRKQVFHITATNDYKNNSYYSLRFKLGANSVIRRKHTYDIRVRLRVTTVSSDPYPSIRVNMYQSDGTTLINGITKDITSSAQDTDYKDFYLTFDATQYALNNIFELLVVLVGTTNDTTKHCYIEEVEFYDTTPKTYL